MKRVVVPLAEGFEEIEALSIVDILRRAEVEVKTASLNDELVKGAHEVVIKSDMKLEDVESDKFDMIVLPGGLPGAEYLAKSEVLKNLLKDFDKQNKPIGAICAAPWALKEAKVLKDSYTCYPSFEDIIKHDGYQEDKKVVENKNIITSKGPATAMEFALYLVKMLQGEVKYKEIKQGLLA